MGSARHARAYNFDLMRALNKSTHKFKKKEREKKTASTGWLMDGF